MLPPSRKRDICCLTNLILNVDYKGLCGLSALSGFYRQQNRKNSASNKSLIVISYRRNITLIALVLYWCLYKCKFMQILCWSSYRNWNVWEYWGFISMQAERTSTSRTLYFNSVVDLGCLLECFWNAGVGVTVLVWCLVLKSTTKIKYQTQRENMIAILTHKHCMHWYILFQCIWSNVASDTLLGLKKSQPGFNNANRQEPPTG